MMLWLVAAAVVSGGPDRSAELPPAPVVRQATVSVRIISGVPLKLDSPVNPGAPAPRDSKVRINGEQQPARLIEFQ